MLSKSSSSEPIFYEYIPQLRCLSKQKVANIFFGLMVGLGGLGLVAAGVGLASIGAHQHLWSAGIGLSQTKAIILSAVGFGGGTLLASIGTIALILLNKKKKEEQAPREVLEEGDSEESEPEREYKNPPRWHSTQPSLRDRDPDLFKGLEDALLILNIPNEYTILPYKEGYTIFLANIKYGAFPYPQKALTILHIGGVFSRDQFELEKEEFEKSGGERWKYTFVSNPHTEETSNDVPELEGQDGQ